MVLPIIPSSSNFEHKKTFLCPICQRYCHKPRKVISQSFRSSSKPLCPTKNSFLPRRELELTIGPGGEIRLNPVSLCNNDSIKWGCEVCLSHSPHQIKNPGEGLRGIQEGFAFQERPQQVRMLVHCYSCLCCSVKRYQCQDFFALSDFKRTTRFGVTLNNLASQKILTI